MTIKKLKDVGVGTYYINLENSVFIDDRYKGLWLDLDSVVFKKKIPFIFVPDIFNFTILRVSESTKFDFKLPQSFKYGYDEYDLRDFSKLVNSLNNIIGDFEINLLDLIDLILNPGSVIDPLREEGLRISQDALENLITQIIRLKLDSKKSKIILRNFKFFLKDKVKKKSFNELLLDGRYSLIFGRLVFKDFEKYIVETCFGYKIKDGLEWDKLKKKFERNLGNIIIEESILNDFYEKIGLVEVCSKKKIPEMGGVVLYGPGGTGKSELIGALKRFWEKDLGGSISEKNGFSEFRNTDNFAWKIMSWYFGEDGYNSKDSLYYDAPKNGVPSLLIIDEIETLLSVKDEDGQSNKDGILVSTELKRLIQSYKKGGCTGYVVTIFIGNFKNLRSLDSPLIDGGERLSPLLIGPPKNIEVWEEILISRYREFNKGDPSNEEKEVLRKVSELLFEYNKLVGYNFSLVQTQRNVVSIFESFISNYNINGFYEYLVRYILNHIEENEVNVQHFINEFLNIVSKINASEISATQNNNPQESSDGDQKEILGYLLFALSGIRNSCNMGDKIGKNFLNIISSFLSHYEEINFFSYFKFNDEEKNIFLSLLGGIIDSFDENGNLNENITLNDVKNNLTDAINILRSKFSK